MAPLLTNVIELMRAGRGAPRCMVCGKRIAKTQESMRVRGYERAHRGCATYSMRRRREGQSRLGYPPRYTGR